MSSDIEWDLEEGEVRTREVSVHMDIDAGDFFERDRMFVEEACQYFDERTGCEVKFSDGLFYPVYTGVLPLRVPVVSAFPLVLRGRDLLSSFRSERAMSVSDAKSWWENCGLKVQCNYVNNRFELLLRCSCGGYHVQVPCEKKIRQMHRDCVSCGASVLRNVLIEGMCQSCRAYEIIDCAQCLMRVPRQHLCKSLKHEAVCMGRGTVYPPFRLISGTKKGVCVDCQEVMCYQQYARHQKRRHCYLKADKFGDRCYRFRGCTYCDYRTTDTHSLKNHMRTHTTAKDYECVDCGRVYGSLSALHVHRRLKHFVPSTNRGVHYTLRDGELSRVEGDDEVVDV